MLDEERPRLEGELVGIPAANLSRPFSTEERRNHSYPGKVGWSAQTHESGERVVTRRGRDLSVSDPQCRSSGRGLGTVPLIFVMTNDGHFVRESSAKCALSRTRFALIDE